MRSNLVNCNQDDLKNYQQNRDSIIQSLVVKGTLVISIILRWEFTINRSISTKQIETNPFIMRIFFRFESVIHWGKKWFFVQMTHFWKEIVEIYFLNSSISNSNFLKLKLSQNTVDYLNLWYYSKRKISIDRLEIMIFQEFVFLWIDYSTWKVSIRNYLPPQYLAASKIFNWNFIF